MIVYPEDYRRYPRMNEGRNFSRIPRRGSRLSEYRIADFKLAGKNASKYTTDMHATDQRFRERVAVSTPKYLGMKVDYFGGRFDLIFYTKIVSTYKSKKDPDRILRKNEWLQTICLKNFLWDVIDYLVSNGYYTRNDRGEVVWNNGKIERDITGQELTPREIEAIKRGEAINHIVARFNDAMNDIGGSNIEFLGKCTCPDFVNRGSKVLASKGGLYEGEDPNEELTYLANNGPGCKHLYKVTMRSSDFARPLCADLLRYLKSPEGIKFVTRHYDIPAMVEFNDD